MRSIGFIDYFLDEWHANKYPEWIEAASQGKMKVVCAYGKKDSDTGLSNAAWCAAKGIELLSSIEEVVERSDCLIVLSPDHPEQHEELARLSLQSGKPTYIDKTFAPDRAAALRLFDLAQRHGTPLYSSSALRFATEYREAGREGIDAIASIGPGSYANYSIHQIEPIVSLLGSAAQRVMFIGTPASPALLIEFSGGRQATVRHLSGDAPFQLAVNYGPAGSAILKPESDFFQLFIRDLIRFFETGQSTVDASETVAVITIIEYGLKAAVAPFQWVELPG
ncbi:Gfo/Idh/MocA family protein [Paenibacillus puerhi]|uniref:Gfo/Idh/MocA family protein n=1 Tax=Paenibacillus puerhi TaxID=2692622 RepID=UPI001356C8B6|nr:Gfo/Idh/MocA family oxidoreductase [Paenibacillus puerhi]